MGKAENVPVLIPYGIKLQVIGDTQPEGEDKASSETQQLVRQLSLGDKVSCTSQRITHPAKLNLCANTVNTMYSLANPLANSLCPKSPHANSSLCHHTNSCGTPTKMHFR